MRKFYLAVTVVAVTSMSVPAEALSPNECYALNAQIKRSRSLARTGGFTVTAELRSARKAEENARDDMVRSGCNKKINASKPECQAIIARVHDAAAERSAAEGSRVQVQQAAAAADEAVLTARYETECLSQARAPRAPERQPVARKPRHEQFTPEDAATAGLILGLGILGSSRFDRPQRGPSGHIRR